MLDDSVLDDQRRIFELDTGGLLRMAALGGAQVRAAASAASEAGVDDLAGYKPRALVLLSTSGVGPATCRLLAALLGSSCPVPVVTTDVVPTWVGPLDVVFAYGADGGDTSLAESLELATRRGASVILAAPDEGPVGAAAAGRAKTISPRIPVPEPLSIAHAFTAGVRVLTALGLLDTDTDALADALDEQAERSHPRHEISENPAKTLALRLADRIPLLWGVDGPSTAVAEHGSFVLGRYAGIPCDVTDYQQSVHRAALYRAAATVGSEADLFADPTEETTAGWRVVLLSTRDGERARFTERTATAALPGADVLAPNESQQGDGVRSSLCLAVGFDMAAVYIGLASDSLNGDDRPVSAAR
ncbi:phospho-glucose isomerase C-terminal SIS domain-containing protein [Actinopolyspora alba]|uniref:Phospho-glucose isomerase C-terminal SIS domain-containing protein n=1 Tax=Actinopolyspora alba TaxID=673379 RepID=A0A1I1Z570_9ACTN|nr:SIS domain-containing protein [Actinopolyspora alba]SFE25480.1 phospho-glucose isomerase C-terminal SIS domain-containing protein [Actinopolyspora alba]